MATYPWGCNLQYSARMWKCHMFNRADTLFKVKIKIHSRRPQWPNWTIEQFLEIGHVIMHIVSSCSWTRFPLLRKVVADLSQRQIGAPGRQIQVSRIMIADHRYCHPLYCDLAKWNEIQIWKCTRNESAAILQSRFARTAFSCYIARWKICMHTFVCKRTQK